MSVALITSAGIFAQSIRQLGIVNISERFGSHYASVEHFTKEDVMKLERHLMTDKVGTAATVGKVPLSEGLSTIIQAPDADWIRLKGYDLEEGRYPDSPGEIAVEGWIYRAARNPVDIGSRITLTIRMNGNSEDGENRTGPGTAEYSFTVVGLLVPDPAGITRGAARSVVSQEQAKNILGSSIHYKAAFTTKKEFEPQEAIFAVADSFGLDPDNDIYQNTALLSALGSSSSEPLNDALMTVELVVALILVIATVAVIYNSFAISVMERIRQFGILRTIGATPKQIRKLVFRQAGIITAF